MKKSKKVKIKDHSKLFTLKENLVTNKLHKLIININKLTASYNYAAKICESGKKLQGNATSFSAFALNQRIISWIKDQIKEMADTSVDPGEEYNEEDFPGLFEKFIHGMPTKFLLARDGSNCNMLQYCIDLSGNYSDDSEGCINHEHLVNEISHHLGTEGLLYQAASHHSKDGNAFHHLLKDVFFIDQKLQFILPYLKLNETKKLLKSENQENKNFFELFSEMMKSTSHQLEVNFADSINHLYKKLGEQLFDPDLGLKNVWGIIAIASYESQESFLNKLDENLFDNWRSVTEPVTKHHLHR
jgi:hypothetical protein